MAEHWQTEVDQRQYERMKDQIHQYEQGRSDLGSLIIGLDALLGLLTSAEESWQDEFRSRWGILEEVYAVAIFRVEQGTSTTLDAEINLPENKLLIDDTLNHLKRLISLCIKREDGAEYD